MVSREQLQVVAREAVKRAGGGSALARKLGVTKGAVSLWYNSPKQYGVPPHFLAVVAQLSGIPEWELRPDVLRKPS